MPSLMPNGDPADQSWGYVRAEHLLELRDFVKKHPLTPTNRIVEWAKALQLKEAEIIRLSEEKERKKRRRTKEEGGEEPSHPAGEPPGEIVNVPKKEVDTPSPEKSVLIIPRRAVEGFSTDDLLRSSPVAESKIIRSTSSKLNRILAEVCWPCPSIIIQP